METFGKYWDREFLTPMASHVVDLDPRYVAEIVHRHQEARYKPLLEALEFYANRGADRNWAQMIDQRFNVIMNDVEIVNKGGAGIAGKTARAALKQFNTN